MRLLWSLLFIALFSCNTQTTIEPGNYLLYDLLDDTSFYATETLQKDGTGEFKELNIYQKDTCTLAIIQFNWTAIQNKIVYKDQIYNKIVNCQEKEGEEYLENQFYTILEKGQDFFVAKTIYDSGIPPLDSSVVLWKKIN